MVKVIKKAGRVLSDSEISKKYKGSGYANDIFVLPEDALWLPSRNLYLNYTMGGGTPYGKILEIFGGESSGKSLLALDLCYTAQYLGGIALWNDAEQAFDPYWAKLNGLDLEKIIVYNEPAIEKISDWAADMATTWRSRLTGNQPIILVTDSTAALDCQDNINSVQSDAKAEMGNRAKALYKYLRIRNQLFYELGIVVVFINQLRKKVGAGIYEDPDTTPGGDAMKFYASQRLAFFRKKQITTGTGDNKVWVGNEVSVRLKKNKVAPPKQSFTTKVYFNEEYGKIGFDKSDMLIELLEKTNVLVRKKGSSIYYHNDDKVARGYDDMYNVLEDNSELRRKLIKESGVNTISKTKRKIERLQKQNINRYKVSISKKKSVNEEEN